MYNVNRVNYDVTPTEGKKLNIRIDKCMALSSGSDLTLTEAKATEQKCSLSKHKTATSHTLNKETDIYILRQTVPILATNTRACYFRYNLFYSISSLKRDFVWPISHSTATCLNALKCHGLKF